ncbi:MAG: TIGR04219 family outer membrane beta-barrel protein [Gammaproteobacteria bacterium]|nr:TIGR04219 family outer membrane beta-barrel protein [Gammaproteobacteria bacterium]
MNRTLPVIMLAALLPATAVADTGITLGARYGTSDINGSLRQSSTSSADDLDINDDLGYRDASPENFYLQLEHPLPLLPNARLNRSGMDESASGQLTRTVDFAGSTFTLGETVGSTVDVTQTDIILYYSIFDTVANIDVGVNAKHLDSSASLTGSLAGNETASISGWVPMLYAGVGVDLPLTGLSIGADGSYTGYQGSRLYDLNLRASYTTDWHIGADLGYRRMKLNLDDFDDSYSDIEFDGPYAGVFVTF